ncbi:OsmC family protein [Oceanobacillus halotolerans]|uniref:OsmC family protein n=1 Tax=Oceanobacillus halotolerans TaxID=2663380 RepID=UPI0013D9F352|nr:OsmC family protein [Oceanobacillus halotolerans]
MEFHITEHGMRSNFEYGELNVSGNEEHGFRPFQLMVASIVGCSGSVFRRILQKQQIPISDLKIAAEVDRNEDEANRIEAIRLHYTVSGKRLDPDKLYKSLEIARKNCPIVRSVEDSIKITETIQTIEISD